MFRKDFLSQLPSRKDFLSHAYHDGGALNFILDDGGLWNHSEEPNTGNYRTRVRSFSTLFANLLTDWLGPKNIPTCLWDVSLEQEEDQTLYLLTPCVTLPQERTLWLLTELAMQTFWSSALFSCPQLYVNIHTYIFTVGPCWLWCWWRTGEELRDDYATYEHPAWLVALCRFAIHSLVALKCYHIALTWLSTQARIISSPGSLTWTWTTSNCPKIRSKHFERPKPAKTLYGHLIKDKRKTSSNYLFVWYLSND